MARSTKIVGFSVPPEIYKDLEELTHSKHQTRSEFIREMIEVYKRSGEKMLQDGSKLDQGIPNLAQILKTYWLIRAQSPIKIITIGLGIITNKTGQVLIGGRRGKDPFIKNLSWVFPGGEMESLDFESEVKREVKEETGLEVEVNSLITARLHPDASYKRVQIVALYFHCRVRGNEDKGRPAGDLFEIKWVNPTDVFKYFTTSTSDELTRFLVAIEEKGDS